MSLSLSLVCCPLADTQRVFRERALLPPLAPRLLHSSTAFARKATLTSTRHNLPPPSPFAPIPPRFLSAFLLDSASLDSSSHTPISSRPRCANQRHSTLSHPLRSHSHDLTIVIVQAGHTPRLSPSAPTPELSRSVRCPAIAVSLAYDRPTTSVVEKFTNNSTYILDSTPPHSLVFSIPAFPG